MKLAARPWVEVRGIYGGVPRQLLEHGGTLADHGVNAIWIGSGGLRQEDIALLRDQGAAVYAEFNTLHEAGYLAEHPDAAPVGPDGSVCPPPDGWQGICPTHPEYRRYRMDTFRAVLERFPIDGIWLDYHHAHASWEQSEPNLPDTCFCARCLRRFSADTGLDLPGSAPAAAPLLLGPERERWTAWRCDLLTGWVREFREIVDAVRPGALLGTFHCPWSETERGGALREKLAIDLPAQAPLLDVLSPMPYHARFGHVTDPEWIARQTAWLGGRLGLRGAEGERPRIWPIVQLSDWGEPVPADQVEAVLDYGTRPPATGVMVFAWGRLHESRDKVEAMSRFYRAIAPPAGA